MKLLIYRAGRHALRNSRALSSSVHSRVTIIGSDDAYAKITTEGTGRRAVVYFTAKWCPPCKMINPIFHELSTKTLTLPSWTLMSSMTLLPRLVCGRCLRSSTSRMASSSSLSRYTMIKMLVIVQTLVSLHLFAL
uniref:Thioredoxin domain-containing protein n=1 Tax=Hyaloperonospora arabidopsidis (strain Emoy2) TaxID=559515 RepID=M4B971_HYAAE